ncbi:hypothetical protein BGX26_004442, partial [Mortierella sp. AD094]
MKASPLFQAFRPVYNVGTPTNSLPLPEAVKIESHFDIKIKENIILWSDICTAFKNPLHVRNDGALVPFLKDENLEPCKPLRIRTHPNIVLEAVLEAPLDLLRQGVIDTSLIASTTIDSQTYGTSSTPQHHIGGSAITVTPIPDLIDLPPQYTRDNNSASSSATGSSTSGTKQKTTADNPNANTPEVGILRNTDGEGSEDYEQGLEYYYGKGVPIDYN